MDECHSAQSRGWVAVNTHTRKEATAIANLARQEFETYCPMMRRSVRHARRARDVLRPLFPGYLFVAVDPLTTRWRKIASTVGVRRLVIFGDELALLPDDFVASLRMREVDGAIVRPASDFKIGQPVRMAGGAFDGLVATIIDMDEKDRLVVLLDLLSRKVKVQVESSLVSAH